MKADLRSVVQNRQPSYTLATLSIALSSRKSKRVFMLVEGDWDCIFYRRNISVEPEYIRRAETDARGGCHSVEHIVAEIDRRYPNSRVYGIRDRDYTRFEPEYKSHPKVFCTDDHSLEMMLLHSGAVRARLSELLPAFDAVYPSVCLDAREIAQYYVYDRRKSLGMDFKSAGLHLKDFLDRGAAKMREGWRGELQHRFFSDVRCAGHTATAMSRDLQHIAFETMDNYAVCRGHDVLGVLYERTKHGGMTMAGLMQHMIDTYPSADFSKTALSAKVK